VPASARRGRSSRRTVVSVPLEPVNGSERVGRRPEICFRGRGSAVTRDRRRACSSVASGSLLCQLDERERRRVARACFRPFSGCVAVRARRLTPRAGTPIVLWSSFCAGPISLPSDAGASIDECDRVVKVNHERRAGLGTRRTGERDGGGPVLGREESGSGDQARDSRGRRAVGPIHASGPLVAGRTRRCWRCAVVRRWRGSRR
jgi:hypothetical protein